MAQTYKYTIEGNTQPAVKGNEALDASINKVDASTKQLQTDLGKTSIESNKAFGAELETKIKASDAQIKRISGTVGLFTGTISTAVGALGLLGIDDEQIKGFQQATLSVLALGSGAAQAITGIKDLTESRKLLTELNNASTVAENSNTAALVTNASAAESVTIAQNAAAVSITSEKTATDGNTISKGVNTAATTVNTTATEGLTLAKRAQLLVEQALNKVQKLSLGGWIAIGVAIATAAKFIYDWTQASKGEEGQLKTTIELRRQELELLKETNRQYLNAEAQLKVLEAGAKARGRSITEEATAEKQRAKDAIDRANKEIQLLREGVAVGRVTQEQVQDQIDRQKILRGEAEKYYNQVIAAETLYASNIKDTNQKNKDRNKQLRDERLEREGITQLIKLEGEELIDALIYKDRPWWEWTQVWVGKYKDLKEELGDVVLTLKRVGEPVDLRNLKDLETTIEGIGLALEEIDFNEFEDNITFLSREQLDILKRLRGELDTELKQQLFDREQTYYQELALFADNEEAKNRLTEEYEQDRAKIRRQYAIQNAQEIIGITSNFLNVIAEINQSSLELQLAQAAGNQAAIDRINKDALERQKKLRIAQTLVTTAESILNGFNATSTLPPPFNFIAGGVLAAAYAALGAKTIQTISSTTLEGGGSASGFNNIPGGGAAFGSINLGGAAAPNAPFPTGILPGVGGGRLGGPTGVGEAQMPIRAYVLAGDVENGVQANLALNNRRRLAG
jgi:hypothetical protein